jgi:hypothetical protein
MRGFKSTAHLQRFASVHGVVQNLFSGWPTSAAGRASPFTAHAGLHRMGAGDVCLLIRMTGVRHPATVERSVRQLDNTSQDDHLETQGWETSGRRGRVGVRFHLGTHPQRLHHGSSGVRLGRPGEVPHHASYDLTFRNDRQRLGRHPHTS